METPNIQQQLAEMLRRTVADPTLHPEDNVDLHEDLAGSNSFKFAELLIEAQEHFDTEIRGRWIEPIAAFGDLVAAAR
jgi:acyl carrier protein